MNQPDSGPASKAERRARAQALRALGDITAGGHTRARAERVNQAAGAMRRAMAGGGGRVTPRKARQD